MSQTFQGRRGVQAADIQRYRSALPTADSIWSPLYDYQLYPAAGQLAFTFFSVPIGQGTTSAPGGAGTKTILDTNLQVAGQLPLGNRFLVQGIEIEYFPTSTPGFFKATAPTAAETFPLSNDVYSVLRNGALTFTIQNRVFAQDAPLMKFPTQSRLAMSGAAADSVAAVYVSQDYAAACGAAYSIVPVYIESTQAFNVTVNFPALIPTVSTQTGRIGCRLVGKLVRNAQ